MKLRPTVVLLLLSLLSGSVFAGGLVALPEPGFSNCLRLAL
jgi:hypothetical protein